MGFSSSLSLFFHFLVGCIIIVSLSLLPLPVLSHCNNPPVIFNFGDSNSDTGGLAAGLGFPIKPPNGRTFFGTSTGRLSDGRLVLDFLFMKTSMKSSIVDNDFETVVIDATSGTTIRGNTVVTPKRVTQYMKVSPIKRLSLVSEKKDTMLQPVRTTKLFANDNSHWHGCYRSNMVTIATKMSSLELRPAHLSYLKKTPFWVIFDALSTHKLDPKKCRKYEDLVVILLGTYQKTYSAFKLGSKMVKLTKNDVKLIFGINCGERVIDLSYCNVATMDFVARRSLTTHDRLSAKTINKLIDRLLPSNKDEDVQDVVRLLCLHICLTLFFSTSGTTIGWGYLKLMEDLEIMREFDWADSITNALMTTIHNHNGNTHKVTGCVIALLYWFCEHTTIIQCEVDNAIPRLLKWDLQALHKQLNKTTLGILKDMEVNDAELVPSSLEKQIYMEGIVDLSSPIHGDIRHEVVPSADRRKKRKEVESMYNMPNFDLHVDMTQFDANTHIRNDSEKVVLKDENSEMKAQIEDLIIKINGLEAVIVQLNCRIVELEDNAKKQSKEHLTTIQLKDAEICVLSGQLDELRVEKSNLIGSMQTVNRFVPPEDEIPNTYDDETERIVHGITQKYRFDNIVEDVGFCQNSMVRDIKAKPRKGNFLPDYVYNEIRLKKIPPTYKKQSIVQSFKEVVENEHQSVVLEKYPVYGMMSKEDRSRFNHILRISTDNVCIWTGSKNYNCVYIDDIVELITDEFTSSWVIDAFGEILMAKQEAMKCQNMGIEDDPACDEKYKSYLCTSLFMDLIKDKNKTETNHLLMDLLTAAKSFRYIHFPLHHNNHFTLTVYDQVDGVWKFYNSVLPPKGRDYHCDPARRLKKMMDEYHRILLNLTAEETTTDMQRIRDSPQQDSHSVDCAQVVCYLMKQYCTNKQDNIFKGVLHRDRTRRIRADLVHEFLSDPIRSWNESNQYRGGVIGLDSP